MKDKIPSPRRQRILIKFELKIGRLTIGELVQYAVEHPLFIVTRLSYIQQGRLYECECDCGQQVLISENSLATGFVKSCGCLLREKREQAHNKTLVKEEIKRQKRELNYKIKEAQIKLKTLLMQPIHIRQSKESNLAVTETAAELRKLFALKGHVTRKE